MLIKRFRSQFAPRLHICVNSTPATIAVKRTNRSGACALRCSEGVLVGIEVFWGAAFGDLGTLLGTLGVLVGALGTLEIP